MPERKRATFLASPPNVEMVFGSEMVQRVRALCDVVVSSIPDTDPETVREALDGVEIVLGTWGMPKMTADILDAAPRLKILIYGASSVKYFVTDAVYERGITVTTAAKGNGAAVAEFTMALITLSLKNAWPRVFGLRREGRAFWRREDWGVTRGLFKATIGVVAAGFAGRELLRLLRNYECTVLLHDPYVTTEEARELGAAKVELSALLARSDVVTLHAPLLPETQKMINAERLRMMKDGAILINTARGGLVDEDALIAELRKGRLMACLDVAEPEPPVEGSRLYTLPNVILTPHLAGAMAMDCRRMGELCFQELERYLAGLPPLHPVTRERLPITS